MKDLESKVEKLDSMLDLKLDGSVFDTFLLKIDSTFKDAIESCYNTFTAISEPKGTLINFCNTGSSASPFFESEL